MYTCLWLARECLGYYDKDTPVKENKWVIQKRIKEYYASVTKCWSGISSSKVKSTSWLIINHSLPVASRVHRKVLTTCKVCNGSNVDHAHVFEMCPRAKDVWAKVNERLHAYYNIEVEASFDDVLNPGKLEYPAGKIVDAV